MFRYGLIKQTRELSKLSLITTSYTESYRIPQDGKKMDFFFNDDKGIISIRYHWIETDGLSEFLDLIRMKASDVLICEYVEELKKYMP